MKTLPPTLIQHIPTKLPCARRYQSDMAGVIWLCPALSCCLRGLGGIFALGTAPKPESKLCHARVAESAA